MSAGKGDSPRPVDIDVYGKNYESIFRKPKQDPDIDICEKMDKPTPIPYTEYRLLEVGELIQDGDEFYSETTDMWFPTNIGNTLTKSTSATKHRRKVETPVPNTEYYYLKPNDIIQVGDEWYNDDRKEWGETGFRFRETVAGGLPYRRKVEASNEPELCTCGRIKINHFMLGLFAKTAKSNGKIPIDFAAH